MFFFIITYFLASATYTPENYFFLFENIFTKEFLLHILVFFFPTWLQEKYYYITAELRVKQNDCRVVLLILMMQLN